MFFMNLFEILQYFLLQILEKGLEFCFFFMLLLSFEYPEQKL